MKYKMITATIETIVLEKVEQRLRQTGVPGITVSQAQGYGSYKNFYHRDWLETHARIQVIAELARVAEIATAIMEAASTGSENDGIVVVTPVDQLFRICDQSRL